MSTQMILGRDVIDASMGNARYIAGIAIDNPSGSWLLVTGIQQYVPPYVNGWSYPVDPQQPSISIKFVDSPSGSVSTLEGTPPSYSLSSTPLPVDPGFPSGSGARVTTIPPFSVAADSQQVFNIGPPPDFGIINITPNFTIVIRRVSIQFIYSNPTADVFVQWRSGDPFGPGPTFEFDQSISPEMPYTSDVLEDGAWRIPSKDNAGGIGVGLYVNALTEPNAAVQIVRFSAQYYLENEI